MNDTYSSYLQSAAWDAKRRERLARSEFMCEACGCRDYLQVHHLTYERIFREEMGDLMTLCELHHRAAEEMIRKQVIPRSGDVDFLAYETLRYIAPIEYKEWRRNNPERFPKTPKPKPIPLHSTPARYMHLTKKTPPHEIQELLKSDPEFMKIVHLPPKQYRKACRRMFGKSPIRGKITSNAQVVYRKHLTPF